MCIPDVLTVDEASDRRRGIRLGHARRDRFDRARRCYVHLLPPCLSLRNQEPVGQPPTGLPDQLESRPTLIGRQSSGFDVTSVSPTTRPGPLPPAFTVGRRALRARTRSVGRGRTASASAAPHHLRALDETLRPEGGGLTIRSEPAATTVVDTAARSRPRRSTTTPTTRRLLVDEMVRSMTLGPNRSMAVEVFHGNVVHEPGTVLTKSGCLSQVFSPFHRRWQQTPMAPWPVAGCGRVR